MAGLTLPAEDPYRVGTAIGTSLGGMLSGQKFHRQWLKEGLDINLGEGGAFFILENYEHAKKRGAKIYGELLGYGLSADAYHPTAPDLGGGGASRAMEAGLADGNVPKKKVAYVNGHGTGTVANDHAEKLACKKVFEDRISQIPISSIKGAIGHCLGAAGAQEAAACIMSLNNGKVPPTINFVHGEEDQAYNFVPDKSQERDCQVVMSNYFAFGGNNCSLVLGKAEENRDVAEKTKENIVITGMGCCGSGGRNISDELMRSPSLL